MAAHSSTLAWRIPWIEEPGGLQSMGSLRFEHNWVTSLWLFTFMHWRRKRHPTPVFLPGESQGQGAWWAAVYGVAQSQTQLKRLSSSSSSSRFDSWMGKIRWRRDRLPTPMFLGFCCGSADKESACNTEDLGSIPGLGRSPGEGKGCPLQYSGLENYVDCMVHGVAKSQPQLSDFHFHFHSHPYMTTAKTIALTIWTSVAK